MVILLTRYEIRLIDFEGTMKSPKSMVSKPMNLYVHIAGLVGGIICTMVLIGQNFKNYKGIAYYLFIEMSLCLIVFTMINSNEDD